ncbi:MAG: hypothetical protein MUF01_17170 [Bryobacterales bacterium]|nr:hypothetical protein [Bryobacterales bacterium]
MPVTSEAPANQPVRLQEIPLPSAADPLFDETPEPTYGSLLRHLLAAHGEFYRDDPGMATMAYLYFVLPPAGTPECTAVYSVRGDEFAKRKRMAEVQTKFRQLLQEAPSWPKSGRYRFWTVVNIGEYDFEKKQYPLVPVSRAISLLPYQGASPEFAMAAQKSSFVVGIEYGSVAGPGRDWCAPADLDLSRINGEVRSKALVIRLLGTQGFATLPMDTDQAEQLRLKTDSPALQPLAILEVIADVEEAAFMERRGAAGAKSPTFVARARAARVLSMDRKHVIYKFPSDRRPSEAQPDEPSVRSASPLPSSPLSGYRLNLLAYHHQPEILKESDLISLTMNQLYAEINTWELLDTNRPRAGRIPGAGHSKPTEFFFQWQKLVGENAKLANGPVLDTFLDPANDWSFVRQQPGWDDRTNDSGKVVEAFVFSKEAIINRNAEFAARELAPVFKSHLDAAAGKVPSRLHFDILLPGAAYDFSTGQVRFLKEGTARDFNGRYEFVADSGPLLDMKSLVPKWPVLPGERGRHVYWYGSKRHKVLQLQRSGEIASRDAAFRFSRRVNENPGKRWRSLLEAGDIWPLELFAFDRELKIGGIPLAQAQAEKLDVSNQYLTATVVFTVEDVESAEVAPEGKDDRPLKLALYLCRLESITVKTASGGHVATINESPAMPTTSTPRTAKPQRATGSAERKRP